MSYFYTKPFFYEESLLFFYYGVLSTSLEDYLKLCFKNCPFYCVSHLVYNLNNIAKAGKLFVTFILNRILFIVLFALEPHFSPNAVLIRRYTRQNISHHTVNHVGLRRFSTTITRCALSLWVSPPLLLLLGH